MEHGCDVLAIAFRPDGKEICTATTNGNLTFWDPFENTQLSVIEGTFFIGHYKFTFKDGKDINRFNFFASGRRDISGGRLTTDAMTSQNSARSKYFTSVTYTADGACVLTGGRSKFVCIYHVATGVLVKKFQLSHNRSAK